MFESIRNDSKAKALAAVWVKDKKCQMMSCHMWTTASKAEKEIFWGLYHDWWGKADTLQ